MSSEGANVVNEFKQYMAKHPSYFSQWYVGITNDPENRLFIQHNVTKHPGIWIYKNTTLSNIAREVEQYFIDVHKTKGGSGGGDNTATTVYAYFVTNTTIQ